MEKIQDLARRGIPMPVEYERAKGMAMKKAITRADLYKDVLDKDEKTKPAEIVKEGLSEYFIYTIEGTQTVPNGWSKRLSSFRARQVKFDILYRPVSYTHLTLPTN